jgi:hypothetical protein
VSLRPNSSAPQKGIRRRLGGNSRLALRLRRRGAGDALRSHPADPRVGRRRFCRRDLPPAVGDGLLGQAVVRPPDLEEEVCPLRVVGWQDALSRGESLFCCAQLPLEAAVVCASTSLTSASLSSTSRSRLGSRLGFVWVSKAECDQGQPSLKEQRMVWVADAQRGGNEGAQPPLDTGGWHALRRQDL